MTKWSLKFPQDTHFAFFILSKLKLVITAGWLWSLRWCSWGKTDFYKPKSSSAVLVGKITHLNSFFFLFFWQTTQANSKFYTSPKNKTYKLQDSNHTEAIPSILRISVNAMRYFYYLLNCITNFSAYNFSKQQFWQMPKIITFIISKKKKISVSTMNI